MRFTEEEAMKNPAMRAALKRHDAVKVRKSLRRVRNAEEATLQREEVKFLEEHFPQTREDVAEHGVIWYAIANERHSKGEAGRMKAQGVRAGVPDLFFSWFYPAPDWRHDGYIENKAKGRKRSPKQVEFKELCTVLGIPNELVRSMGQFKTVLKEWGILT